MFYKCSIWIYRIYLRNFNRINIFQLVYNSYSELKLSTTNSVTRIPIHLLLLVFFAFAIKRKIILANILWQKINTCKFGIEIDSFPWSIIWNWHNCPQRTKKKIGTTFISKTTRIRISEIGTFQIIWKHVIWSICFKDCLKKYR